MGIDLDITISPDDISAVAELLPENSHRTHSIKKYLPDTDDPISVDVSLEEALKDELEAIAGWWTYSNERRNGGQGKSTEVKSDLEAIYNLSRRLLNKIDQGESRNISFHLWDYGLGQALMENDEFSPLGVTPRSGSGQIVKAIRLLNTATSKALDRPDRRTPEHGKGGSWPEKECVEMLSDLWERLTGTTAGYSTTVGSNGVENVSGRFIEFVLACIPLIDGFPQIKTRTLKEWVRQFRDGQFS